MPLQPLITAAIPPQAFQTCEERLCEILLVELAQQHVIDPTNPDISKIWMERCVMFDSDTEIPAINVSLANGDYSLQTNKKADGMYLFNIDIYTNAVSTEENGPADQYAMVKMTKLLGMVRAILSYPAYKTLAFTNGKVGAITVSRFFIADKSTMPDALSSVVGRLQVMVPAVETTELVGSVPLEINGTTVMLDESEFGYYYRFNT